MSVSLYCDECGVKLARNEHACPVCDGESEDVLPVDVAIRRAMLERDAFEILDEW